MPDNIQYIKIGFVPSYRGEWGRTPPWCIQMRLEALAVFAEVKGMEVVVPSR